MLSYETFSGDEGFTAECSPSGESDSDYYFNCPPDIDSCTPEGTCFPDANDCGPDYGEACVPDCDPQE